MMFVRIKEHLSNISSPVHETVKAGLKRCCLYKIRYRDDHDYIRCKEEQSHIKEK